MAHVYRFPSPNPPANSDNTIALVAHGGGGKAFHNSHNLVKFLHNYVSSVISVELPNHGTREKHEIFEKDPSAVIEELKKSLLPHVTGKKVFIVAYSVGAILLFNLLPTFQKVMYPESISIFIGTGIRPNLKKWNLISAFWTREQFVKTKTVDNMAKLHGPDWETSIRSVHTWMECKSAAYLPKEVRQSLVNGENPKVFFVCGTDDKTEPFDPEDVTDDMDKYNAAVRVFGIPCGHWTYFSNHWFMLQTILTSIVTMYGKLPQKSKL